MNRPADTAPANTVAIADLRIMATTDLHMHLLPERTDSAGAATYGGLAGAAALIRTARKEVANSLLFDNGDFLNGSTMGETLVSEYLKGAHEPRAAHPIVATMRALRYDAVNLGNHDFDYGPEYLGRALKGAPFPVVASNLTLNGPETALAPRPLPFARPFQILDRSIADRSGALRDIRIGLLGLMPPGSVSGDQDGVFSVEIRDIVETARAMVPQLRALGADLVVVLAHSGVGEAGHSDGMENAVVPLAEVPGIDAIVSGHTHEVFPTGQVSGGKAHFIDSVGGLIHGTPVVAPGFWGSHLGVIDLALGQGPDGAWRVLASRTEARPVPKPAAPRLSDRRLRRIMEPLRATQDEELGRPVGETRRRIHSYFATSSPSTALDLVHRAMLWFAAGDAEALLPRGLPRLASAAPFSVGGFPGPGHFVDIPPGPIPAHALTALSPFPNTLFALRLTGAELRAWLERAASVFNRIRPGAGDQPLMNPAVPGYAFESVAGCAYEMDLAAPARCSARGDLRDPAAERIRRLEIAGLPVGDDDECVLLTHSFRVAGGGRYPVPGDERRVIDLSVRVRDAVSDYLAAAGPYDGSVTANWRFHPVADARATVFSSPRASELVGARNRPAIVPGEVGADGFQAFNIAL